MKEYNITIPEMERLIDLYEKVAEEFDMSVRQVKDIVYRCQEIIFKHM